MLRISLQHFAQHDRTMVIGAWDLGFPASPSWPGYARCDRSMRCKPQSSRGHCHPERERWISVNWSRDARVASGAEELRGGGAPSHVSAIGPRNLGFPVSPRLTGDTSKSLDKNVVVR